MDRNFGPIEKGEVLKKQTFIETDSKRLNDYQDLTYKYRWSLLPTEHRQ
jgi:hypothetical protein